MFNRSTILLVFRTRAVNRTYTKVTASPLLVLGGGPLHMWVSCWHLHYTAGAHYSAGAHGYHCFRGHGGHASRHAFKFNFRHAGAAEWWLLHWRSHEDGRSRHSALQALSSRGFLHYNHFDRFLNQSCESRSITVKRRCLSSWAVSIYSLLFPPNDYILYNI